MPSTPLALVARDRQLAEAIQARLRSVFENKTLTCPFGSVTECLGPEADGLLLLAASSAADAAEAGQLAREVHLRHWPAEVLVVGPGAVCPEVDWGRLDPYLAGRFGWPRDAAEFIRAVRKGLSHRRGFPVTDAEPLAERLTRELR